MNKMIKVHSSFINYKAYMSIVSNPHSSSLITIYDILNPRPENYHSIPTTNDFNRFSQSSVKSRKDLFDIKKRVDEYFKLNWFKRNVYRLLSKTRWRDDNYYKRDNEDFVCIYIRHIKECVNVTMTFNDKFGVWSDTEC